jgi:alpha-L-fucosidase
MRHLDRRQFLASAAATAAALNRWPPLNDIRISSAPGALADRMSWWREARFGMFIHWGLYSILAGEWGGRDDYAEWIRNNAHIPVHVYDRLLARFNPVRFDAAQWVGMARDAGMKYVTITTKHHDGFCLFGSTHTGFSVRSTPFRRDIMKELATAARSQGLRPCWYHSIMDWHHRDYLPRRDWEAETRSAAGARYARYLEYLHAQVGELLTNYGEIGVMWFDGQWEGSWTHEMGRALYARCRELQPNVVVNNRVEGWSATPVREPLGDFRTPEQEVPATGWPGVDWESCITMNRNWGYNAKDHDFKSAARLIGLLIETASKGGNLLLNVGPKADGSFPPESVERLQAIGAWMRVNGGAIYGSTASPFAAAPFRATSQPNRLNLFLTGWSDAVVLPGLRTPVVRAYLLADAAQTPLAAQLSEAGLRVTLPPSPPDAICSVLVCEFARSPEIRPS